MVSIRAIVSFEPNLGLENPKFFKGFGHVSLEKLYFHLSSHQLLIGENFINVFYFWKN